MLKSMYDTFLLFFSLLSPFFLFSISIEENIQNMPPIVFLHIPKTGGVTVFSTIDNYIPQKAFGAQGGYCSTHFSLYSILQAFSNQIQLVQNCRFITFLRHPVERAISEHKYLMVKHQGRPDFIGIHNLPPDQDPLYSVKNDMCKALSGLKGNDPDISDALHLEKAKVFIDTCYFVGITGRMEDSLTTLFDKLNLPLPKYISKFNECSTDESFSDQLKKEIAERNWADIELYDYAQQRFERELLQFVNTRDESTQIVDSVQHHIFFTFDQPVNGYGWAARYDGVYRSERNQRWVYQTNEAALFFHLDSNEDHSIRLRLIIPNLFAKDINVYVNDTLLTTDVIYLDKSIIEPFIYLDYVGIIPKQILQAGENTKISVKLREPINGMKIRMLNQWKNARKQDNCSRGIFACEELEIIYQEQDEYARTNNELSKE